MWEHTWTDHHSAYVITELPITHEYYFAIISVKHFVTLFQKYPFHDILLETNTTVQGNLLYCWSRQH